MPEIHPPVHAYIAVGSNIEPERNIPKALELLQDRVRVIQSSTFYYTQPIARPEQPSFINGVWKIETTHSPRRLKFEVLRSIEDRLGRIRSEDPYASRPIDLDLLLYDRSVIHEPGLQVPDPDLYRRAFLCIPLKELEPDLILPDTGESIQEVVGALSGEELIAVRELTKLLRERILE